MDKIKSISEAYSNNPSSWCVLDKDHQHFNPKYHCKLIKKEAITSGIGENNHIIKDYYVGYDYGDRKIFQFLADSVNVEFDTEVKNV